MLDSRFRGNDAPVVMPVKTGIPSFARDLRLILAPMPVKGKGGGGLAAAAISHLLHLGVLARGDGHQIANFL